MTFWRGHIYNSILYTPRELSLYPPPPTSREPALVKTGGRLFRVFHSFVVGNRHAYSLPGVRAEPKGRGHIYTSILYKQKRTGEHPHVGAHPSLHSFKNPILQFSIMANPNYRQYPHPRL